THVHRAGAVAVVGRPNVGKSTLVNALVGEKVAIVSDKPQTTRRDIRGIRTTDDVQIVFTDTPGFHKPRTALGVRLNALVGDAVAGVDVVVLVVDGASGVGRGDAYVYEQHVPGAAASICVVNKIDRIRHHAVVPQLAAAGELGDWDEIVPVSAVGGIGVGTLLDLLVARMPVGPALFPGGEVTDQPLEVRIAELVREQAIAVTREEVPHSVAVVIEEVEHDHGLARIYASIVVERDSQKGILIGQAGQTLKSIGSKAREQIELLVGERVFLDLRVKVMKEWQRDPKMLDRLGF
ncbi:MAG TPA: GTPase Era, partial [Actinomycetota bacterium]|nr:GTPase Era [Actinomycetota bacterium]